MTKDLKMNEIDISGYFDMLPSLLLEQAGQAKSATAVSVFIIPLQSCI